MALDEHGHYEQDAFEPDEETWLCDECGKENPEDYLFCDYCGAERP